MGTVRSDRGTSLISGKEFIRVHKVVNGEGAYPGARLDADPGKWLRSSKKHDKQLTFIGRVIRRIYFKILL
jgi:hypothetical protein